MGSKTPCFSAKSKVYPARRITSRLHTEDGPTERDEV